MPLAHQEPYTYIISRATASMNLPDDILTLISDELLAQRDFSTLYNIVVASKSLALCSLPHLYRHVSQHYKQRVK